MGQVTIFPNPFNETLKIELPSTTDFIEVQIFDISGKKIHENNLSGGRTFNLNTADWQHGTYILKATYEDKHLVSKLIK